ncbi:MAG TPA: signal peptidase I [Bacilli bacterium]|nr:signal peptidase I [Bacilli bacterium]
MKRTNFKIYIFVVSIIVLLLLNLFVLGVFSRIVGSIVLLGIFFLSLLFFKYRKDCFYQKNSVIFVMSIIAIFQIVVFYITGLFDGFSNNIIKLSFNNIIILIIPTIVALVIIELIRYLLSNQFNKDKKFEVLCIIMLVLMDVNLFGGSYNFSSLSDTLEFMGLVLFPSVASNIVYNRLTLSYGYKPIVIYRVIVILSYYLIPIVPNTYVFFRSIFKIAYPILFYLLITYMYDRLTFENLRRKNNKSNIATAVTLIFVTLLAGLVSCKFRWGILSIGSNSMGGTFNSGDAVIFERYDDQKIEIGNIIIYEKNNRSVVHRVIEIGVFNGNYVYVTKGDKNELADSGYVYQDDVEGIVKASIKYIGYPSIWIRNLFKLS